MRENKRPGERGDGEKRKAKQKEERVDCKCEKGNTQMGEELEGRGVIVEK